MLIGVVGKPNIGKSTFFKAATLADVEIANYPFATIEANEGVAFVSIECVCGEKEFNRQCNPRTGYCTKNKRFIPVQLIDVAGLVPGASEGKGMGNQFLDDLRQADVLIHVIDLSGSTNERGETVDPLSYDPAEDIKFLERELDMWYLQILSKGWQKFARSLQQEKGKVETALAKQLSGLKVTEEIIEDALRKLDFETEKPQNWTEEQLFLLAKTLRQMTKPMVIACNKVDIPGAFENFQRLQKEFPEHLLIPTSAESELALRQAAKASLIDYIPAEKSFNIINESLTEKQQAALEFIKRSVLEEFEQGTGVQAVLNAAVFSILGYMAIYPGGASKLEDKDGNVLPDCFLLPAKSTALDFAYKLHTDLGKHFIRAIDVKTKKTVGKDHLLKHRDVVEIVAGR